MRNAIRLITVMCVMVLYRDAQGQVADIIDAIPKGVDARAAVAITDGYPAWGLGADWRSSYRRRVAVTMEYRQVPLRIPQAAGLPAARGQAHAVALGLKVDMIRAGAWTHAVSAGPMAVIAETEDLITRAAFGAGAGMSLARGIGESSAWSIGAAVSVAYIHKMRVQCPRTGRAGYIREGIIADSAVFAAVRF